MEKLEFREIDQKISLISVMEASSEASSPTNLDLVMNGRRNDENLLICCENIKNEFDNRHITHGNVVATLQSMEIKTRMFAMESVKTEALRTVIFIFSLFSSAVLSVITDIRRCRGIGYLAGGLDWFIMVVMLNHFTLGFALDFDYFNTHEVSAILVMSISVIMDDRPGRGQKSLADGVWSADGLWIVVMFNCFLVFGYFALDFRYFHSHKVFSILAVGMKIAIIELMAWKFLIRSMIVLSSEVASKDKYLEDSFQIIVKLINNKLITLMVSNDMFVLEIKEKIFAKIGILPDCQSLYFGRRLLHDDAALSKYDLHGASVLVMSAVLLGGGDAQAFAQTLSASLTVLESLKTITKFNGSDAVNWLRETRNKCKLSRIPADHWAQEAVQRCAGPFFTDLKIEELGKLDWAAFETAISAEFLSSIAALSTVKHLRTIRCAALSEVDLNKHAEAFDDVAKTIAGRVEEIQDIYVQSLPMELRKHLLVHQKAGNSWSTAYKEARLFIDRQASALRYETEAKVADNLCPVSQPYYTERGRSPTRQYHSRPDYQRNDAWRSAQDRASSNRSSSRNYSNRNFFCYNCGGPGHYARFCSQPLRSSRYDNGRQPYGTNNRQRPNYSYSAPSAPREEDEHQHWQKPRISGRLQSYDRKPIGQSQANVKPEEYKRSIDGERSKKRAAINALQHQKQSESSSDEDHLNEHGNPPQGGW